MKLSVSMLFLYFGMFLFWSNCIEQRIPFHRNSSIKLHALFVLACIMRQPLICIQLICSTKFKFKVFLKLVEFTCVTVKIWEDMFNMDPLLNYVNLRGEV